MSNVPSWKRNLSKTEYIYKVFELEVYATKVIYNTPSKYRHSFGDTLIRECNRAMYHGRVANDIYLQNEQTRAERLYELSKMKAAVDNICTQAYIWAETILMHDGLSSKQKEKMYKFEESVGNHCDKIISLIEGQKRYVKDRKLEQ